MTRYEAGPTLYMYCSCRWVQKELVEMFRKPRNTDAIRNLEPTKIERSRL